MLSRVAFHERFKSLPCSAGILPSLVAAERRHQRRYGLCGFLVQMMGGCIFCC